MSCVGPIRPVALAIVAATLLVAPCQAQDYPAKAVRVQGRHETELMLGALPLPLAGEGRGGSSLNDGIRGESPHPPRSARHPQSELRSSRPRKRERCSGSAARPIQSNFIPL